MGGISGAWYDGHIKLPPLHSGTFLVGYPTVKYLTTQEVVTYMPKYAELTGKRFNHITVLGQAKDGPRMGWQCLCDCGRIFETRTRSLKVENRKTCGNRDCIYYKALLSGYAYTGDVPLSHLHTAEEVKSMMEQPCTYCGMIKYNGLMPSASKHRLLPVCMKCRKLRGEMKHLDFLSHLKLIAKIQCWDKSSSGEI